MVLIIEDPETVRLVRLLAAHTGESGEVAIRRSLEARLHRLEIGPSKDKLLKDLAASRQRWRQMKVCDARGADETVCYDENGLPC